MKSVRFAATVIAAFSGLFADSEAELPALLPRHALFRDPERGAPLISPDGDHLAWVAPTNGLTNLWVRSVTSNDTRLLSLDPRGTVRQPVWQSDAQAVLYLQDSDGLGNWHVMQAHVPSGNIRDLTPFAGVHARLVATSPRSVDEILVAMNLRNRKLFDLFRIDVRSGAAALEAENGGEITAWFADPDLNLRLTQILLPGGDLALGLRPDPRSIWRPILRWGADDAMGGVVGFGPEASNVWLISNVRAQASRLLDINLATGATAVVAQDARYDVTGALIHPISSRLEAVRFARSRAQWQLLDPNLLTDFEALRRFRDGDLEILSRDVSDDQWTVSYTADNAPVLYALYSRTNRHVTPLFSERPILDNARLARTKPVALKARDGWPLEGYLTLPDGVEPKSLPAVVLVHDGPWTRAIWGFDPEVQWLANRGYVVVQINHRGTTGYGKDHLNAGDKEWGGKILDDLIDTKRWVTEQGYADPGRVAIMGAGFGGYAALAAVALRPGEFAAAISLSGPPNLVAMIEAVPASATAAKAAFERRVGNPGADGELLRAQSPASQASRINVPLLTAITGRDPQVPLDEMDRFVAAVRREGRDVEYLVFADEGATLRGYANRLRLYAAADAFLGRHLHGRVEPPADLERFESLRR